MTDPASPSLRRAGVSLILLTVAAKMAGLIREAVVADAYGTSTVVDLYLAAVTVPILIISILYHSLPNALIPSLVNPEGASDRVRRLSVGILACFGVVAAGLSLFPGPVVSLTAAGFASDLRAESAQLLSLAAFAIVAAALEAITRGRLLAQKRFVQAGLSAAWASLVTILAVLLYPSGGAWTLTWALLIGGVLVVGWNLLPLGRRSAGGTSSAQAERFGAWWIAVVLMVDIMAQLFGLVDRHFASFLPAGSMAALNYAALIATQPVAICGMALGTAIFPYLSERLGAGKHDEAGEILDRAMRWAILGAVPAGIVFFAAAEPIVTLLFERGEFGASSRQMTATLLQAYGIWIVPAVLGTIVAKFHYSARRWQPLVIGGVAGVAIKVALSVLWVDAFGAIGLVWASSAAQWAILLVLVMALPGWSRAPYWRGWLAVGVAAAVAMSSGALVGRLLILSMTSVAKLLAATAQLLVTCVFGIGLLYLFGPKWGLTEIDRLRLSMTQWRTGRRP